MLEWEARRLREFVRGVRAVVDRLGEDVDSLEGRSDQGGMTRIVVVLQCWEHVRTEVRLRRGETTLTLDVQIDPHYLESTTFSAGTATAVRAFDRIYRMLGVEAPVLGDRRPETERVYHAPDVDVAGAVGER